jgi:hypothetical protein
MAWAVLAAVAVPAAAGLAELVLKPLAGPDPDGRAELLEEAGRRRLV